MSFPGWIRPLMPLSRTATRPHLRDGTKRYFFIRFVLVMGTDTASFEVSSRATERHNRSVPAPGADGLRTHRFRCQNPRANLGVRSHPSGTLHSWQKTFSGTRAYPLRTKTHHSKFRRSKRRAVPRSSSTKRAARPRRGPSSTSCSSTPVRATPWLCGDSIASAARRSTCCGPSRNSASEASAFADEDLGNSSDPLTEIPQLSAEVVCC